MLPPLVLFENRIPQFPDEMSFQVTRMFVPSVTMEGRDDSPALLLIFCGVLQVVPPSVLFENRISVFTGDCPYQVTRMFVPSVAMEGENENPALSLLIFWGVVNESANIC